MMPNFLKFSIAFLGGIWLAPLPVLALSPPSTDSQTPSPQSVSDPLRVHQLEELAEQISLTSQVGIHPVQDAIPTIDLRQLPILGDMVDRDGRLQLPLGLTIYNTMGDTSIGFGSKF